MYDLHKLTFFLILWIVIRFILDNLRLLKYVEGNRSSEQPPQYTGGSNRFSEYGTNVSTTVYDQNYTANPFCQTTNPNLCNPKIG